MVRRQTILVVEDHKLLLQAIKDLLEGENYEVMTAVDGATALKLMEDKVPDLIVSDIMMPKMNGYTLYENVRANPGWTRIPFIFLTARGERGDIIRGKALGVEDYITKPFDTEELVTAIRARLRRAQEIRQATEEEFEEIKQQIINVLSHELRTPLTYIAGYTELALEDISSLSMDELQEFLKRIKRGSDRLHNLVEDLLIGVQLDTGRSREEFNSFARVQDNVGQIVQHVVHNYRSQAVSEDVLLETEVNPDLPPVKLYEDFLEDALGRIIGNAIKFSRKPPRHVKVRAYVSNDEVRIAVSDRGVGISEENLDRLFERFEQLERSKMEQQGTGMGLYIAKALIELHGGQITVESKVGSGSTFTIHLPVA